MVRCSMSLMHIVPLMEYVHPALRLRVLYRRQRLLIRQARLHGDPARLSDGFPVVSAPPLSRPQCVEPGRIIEEKLSLTAHAHTVSRRL